jgi:hypothetical protein
VRRRLFNLAATVSLALFVETVALWVRGRLTWKYDRVTFSSAIRDNGGQTSLDATNSPFGIDVGRVRTSAMARASPGWTFRSSRSTVTDTDSVVEAYESLGGHGIAALGGPLLSRRDGRTT